MRSPLSRLLFVLGLVGVLTPAISSAHYTQGVGDIFALVRVDGEAGPSLQDAGLFLVAEVPEGYLAFVDPHEAAELSAAGTPVEVLVERDDASLEYLLAFEHDHDHPLADPHPEARTLYQGPGYRVMAIPADLLEAQPNCVPEIQRIYRRPLSFVRRPWTEPSLAERAEGVDPVIVAALADITQQPLQDQVQTLQDFVTRHSEYNGGYLASLWLRDRFLSYGYTDVTLHSYNNWNDNVVCVKPGTVFPDEYVVIGAHYDSINYSNYGNSPGADDNATGSVAVLETARVLADVEFERTVVFICFSGEEQGLVGSDAWASEAAAEGKNVVAMINLDMIAYRAAGDVEDLDIISNGASQPLADLAFEVIDAYVPELSAVDGYLTSGSSDHASFWARGFRAIFLFEDSGSYSPYIHTTNDRVGTSANSFGFMLKNVKAATAILATLARPFRVALAHEPLSNSEGNGPFPVSAEILSAEPLDASSLWLRYRVDGGSFVELPLLPAGPGLFEATIPAVHPGAQIEYYLSASDVNGYTVTSPESAPDDLHAFRTGIEVVFLEFAETDQGWTLGVPGDNATTGLWIRADPVGTSYQSEDDHTPDPGTRCFVTGNANPGDSAGTNDVDGGRTTLVSPIFDLDGAVWASLSYWRWYVDETAYDDNFYVDISNDGGATWRSLEVVPESAYPWVEAVFDDLGSILPLTGQMRLRFIAEDIGQGSLVEALIDDLEVVAVRTDPAGLETTGSFAAGLSVHPSPFGASTALRFALPHRGRADLRVFDITGAEVGRPVDGLWEAGTHEAVFDASELATGVYFARLWLDGAPIGTAKLTRVR